MPRYIVELVVWFLAGYGAANMFGLMGALIIGVMLIIVYYSLSPKLL